MIESRGYKKNEKAVPAYVEFLSSRGDKGCGQGTQQVYGAQRRGISFQT